MRRLDLLRSYVNQATDRIKEGTKNLLPLDSLREIVGDLRHRRVRILESRLTRAVARTPGIDEASVSAKDGALFIDLYCAESGRGVAAKIEVYVQAFAPRGAKEIGFSVTPESAAENRQLAEALGYLSGTIAEILWAPAGVVPGEVPGAAFIERDGHHSFRADLRTVPSVRAALARPASEMLIEALVPKRFVVGDQALAIELSFPGLR